MRSVKVLLAALVAVTGLGVPAEAHPHDHECVGIVDEDCYIGGPTGRKCDVYVNTGGPPLCNHVVVAATTGTGIILPGLTMVPTFQHTVQFTADIVVGTDGSDPLIATGCFFDGASSIAETDLVGHGSGILSSCVGASVSGYIVYDRQGSLVTISGDLTVNGVPHSVGHNMFLFVPSPPIPPMTSYRLTGALVLD